MKECPAAWKSSRAVLNGKTWKKKEGWDSRREPSAEGTKVRMGRLTWSPSGAHLEARCGLTSQAWAQLGCP